MSTQASAVRDQTQNSCETRRRVAVRPRLLQPIEDRPVVKAEQFLIRALIRRVKGPIAATGEIHKQQIQFQHATAAAPEHALEMPSVVNYRLGVSGH